MLELLRLLMGVSVVAFSITSMLSAGLGSTLRDVFGPMRDSRAVIRALLANFLMVPLLAYALTQVLPLGNSYDTALMLVATAAGAPFLMKLTAVARGNVALAASLTMLLLPVTVLYMPFVVPVLVPEANVSPAAIAMPLLWTMVLPLALGLLIRARLSKVAERVRPLTGKLGSVFLVSLILTTVLSNLPGLGRIISRGAIWSPLILILGAGAIGYVFGREYRGGHLVLGLGTGQRNIAAAMVVATQGLDDPDTVVMVVVLSLIQLGVLFPLAALYRRRTRQQEGLAHA